jgi:dephospho-CoA kinase
LPDAAVRSPETPDHYRTGHRRPLAVAITGGIGAGKSEALAAFARRGVPAVSSDELVHRLYRDDPEVRAAIAERWGERALDERGDPDRERIAEIVFADRDELGWLEQLLHPRVARAYTEWAEKLARLPEPPRLFVAEIPLLYETGGQERFDAVVVVTAPPEVRSARGRKVRQDDRTARLIPDEEKVRRADYAYVNDGTLEELDRFVGRVVQDLSAR